MNIEQTISLKAQEAVKALYGQDVPESMVQLQKTKGTGQWLQEHCDAVERFNVVKGFLSIGVAQKAWVSLLNAINADPTYGEKKATDQSPLVMIEYSSPNTNKPLHLGHVRNNLLG